MTTMLLTHANASVSVSFYMIAGGTSWGFYAGANVWWPKYRAHTTSYDFEAPISEGGTYGQPGMPPGVLQGSKYHVGGDRGCVVVMSMLIVEGSVVALLFVCS